MSPAPLNARIIRGLRYVLITVPGLSKKKFQLLHKKKEKVPIPFFSCTVMILSFDIAKSIMPFTWD